MFKGSPLPPGLISATSVWHSRSSVPLRHGGFGLIINFFPLQLTVLPPPGCCLHLCTCAHGSPSTSSTSPPPSRQPLSRVLSVGEPCTPRLLPGSCLAVLPAGLFVHADFHKLPDVRDCVSASLESPCPAQCQARRWSRGAECIRTGSGRTCWLRGREITASGSRKWHQVRAFGAGLAAIPHSFLAPGLPAVSPGPGPG